ncbi:hypothetical protein [Hymenobacter agri]
MLRSFLFLLFLAGPAAAQTPLAPSVAATELPATPPASRTAADTARAIHRLYARHRHFGAALTAGAIVTDLTLAGISATEESRDEQKSPGGSGYGNFVGNGPLLHFGFGGFALIYGILVAPVAVVGVEQLIAYGPKHEAKVLNQYHDTHTLPKRVARKLRRYLR